MYKRQEYEQLAVYVPGAYMKGTKNQDGTYTACLLYTSAHILTVLVTADAVQRVRPPVEEESLVGGDGIAAEAEGISQHVNGGATVSYTHLDVYKRQL